jgi:hypothetical protein
LSADILANSEQFNFAAIQMDGQGFLFLKASIEAYQSPDHILAKKYFISGKLGKIDANLKRPIIIMSMMCSWNINHIYRHKVCGMIVIMLYLSSPNLSKLKSQIHHMTE